MKKIETKMHENYLDATVRKRAVGYAVDLASLMALVTYPSGAIATPTTTGLLTVLYKML